jgi:hypothetical protein
MLCFSFRGSKHDLIVEKISKEIASYWLQIARCPLALIFRVRSKTFCAIRRRLSLLDIRLHATAISWLNQFKGKEVFSRHVCLVMHIQKSLLSSTRPSPIHHYCINIQQDAVYGVNELQELDTESGLSQKKLECKNLLGLLAPNS